MTVSGIISAIIIGLIIGALGRLIVPGKQDIPIWLTILVDRGRTHRLRDRRSLRDTEGIDWVELLVQVVLAAIGVCAAAVARPQRAIGPAPARMGRHLCGRPDTLRHPPSFSDTPPRFDATGNGPATAHARTSLIEP